MYWNLSTDRYLQSHVIWSCDGHVRVGEWPKATTPPCHSTTTDGIRMGSRVDSGLEGWGLRRPEMTKTGPNDVSGVVCAFSKFFSLFHFV